MFVWRAESVGKLFGLRDWVELKEAPKFLSALIQDDISMPDVLRLAMDGHLTLSVRFITAAYARFGKVIPGGEAQRTVLPTLDGEGHFVCVEGTVLNDGRVIQYEDSIRTIVGVWDLPMIGGERLLIENLYEESQRREPPELFNMEGTFVTDSRDLYCQIVERFDKAANTEKYPRHHPANYYPAATLPDDSAIVVRRVALEQFAARVPGTSDPADDRPLGSRERATLLTLIAALAKMAKIDVSKPSAAAAAIETQTTLMGARVAARTIEEHLKRIPEEARGS